MAPTSKRTKSRISDMAEVMQERSAANGCCTEADLVAAGFTLAEIATHADRARAFALRGVE